MRLCFPYIAQLHQVFHSLPIALEIARRDPMAQVRLACPNPDLVPAIRELARIYAPEVSLPIDRLKRPRLFGRPMSKTAMLLANASYFRGFDAIVVPECTSLNLRHVLPRRTRLIWTRHGAGDRAIGYREDIVRFDFVLLSGVKSEQRLLDAGLIRPGAYATGVYAKFDLVRRLPRPRCFADDKPVVLYNPHFAPALSSWPRWGLSVLDHFAARDDLNVIFAPHVKLFDRASTNERSVVDRYRGCPHMLIDLGSRASVDMTYTRAAHLYLGDVSSQVVEFLVEPRPCVFLDAHGADWQDDPNYRFWHCGPVIGRIEDLAAALDRAIATEYGYAPVQQAYVADSVGDIMNDTAPLGAAAILDFLSRQPSP